MSIGNRTTERIQERAEMSDLNALHKRVERLERQNNRIKCIGLAILLSVGSGFLMGQVSGGKTVVEAQEFILRDAAGKQLASLGTQKRHDLTLGPALRFFDSAGKLRAEFGRPDLTEDPSLNLFSGDETLRARLDVQALDIAAQGAHGVAISLMSGADGSGGLNIDKANEPTKILLTLAPDGSPMLFLGDKTGKAVMGATALGRSGDLANKRRPTSSLVLFGPNWEHLWEAPQLEPEQEK